jgi:hypothetical protein
MSRARQNYARRDGERIHDEAKEMGRSKQIMGSLYEWNTDYKIIIQRRYRACKKRSWSDRNADSSTMWWHMS